ncbi:MAG TPA: hypothetical protein VNT30_15515 [Stellaceae bacterium]|nr:hypothetical protein [Stellaceae bacterium]
MSIREAALNLFTRREPESKPTQPAAKATAPKAGVARPSAEAQAAALTAKLRGVLQGQKQVVTGAFHLIGLAEVRERLGDDWSRVQDKVHLYTQRIIERHLSPRDVYFPCGDEDYVLVFASMDKTAAQFFCAKIIQELHLKLFGDSDTREITVRVAVGEVDGSVHLEEMTVGDLLRGASVDPAADEAIEPSAAPATGPRKLGIPVVTHRPVWDVRREVLSTYFTRYSLTEASPRDPKSAIERLTAEEHTLIDVEVLRSGIDLLTELFENKFRLRLSFPVNFETMAFATGRRSYVSICQMIPEHVRKLAAFELVDLPAGIPYVRLSEVTTPLRPFSGLILATTDWYRADLTPYANAGISVVNAVIPPTADEKTVLADMDRFARAAEKAGLQSSIEGVGTSSLALAAKGAGIGFISGDRIGKCVEVPEHMLHISWKELYFGQRTTGS